MPKHPMTVCAVLAFTGIAIVHCRADPTLVSTNAPPPPPLDQLLSTNVAQPLVSSNSPPLSLAAPLSPRGPKLAQPQMPPPTNILSQETTVPWPGRRPGIYLSSPYAMQVMVPDAIDSGMTHSPSGNWNFDTPVHPPGLQMNQP